MYSPAVASARPDHPPNLVVDARSIDSARRIGAAVVLLVLLAALLTPLAVWGWIGGHARWAADDFQFALELREAGLFQFQADRFLGWTGRFGYTALCAAVYSLGPDAARWLPPCWIVLVLAGLAAAYRELERRLGFGSPGLGGLTLAASTAFAAWVQMPDLHQVLMWTAGSLAYVAPAFLLSLLSGWMMSAAASRRSAPTRVSRLAGLAGLTFVACGFNEAYAVCTVSALAVAFAAAALWPGVDDRRRLVGLTGAVLAAAVLSLVLAAVAPGNEVRRSAYPSVESAGQVVALTVDFTRAFLRDQLQPHTRVLLLAATLAALTVALQSLAWSALRKQRRPSARSAVAAMVCLPTAAVLLVSLVMALSAWATTWYPVARTLSVPIFIVTIAATLIGIATGVLLTHARRSLVAAAAAGLLAVTLVGIRHQVVWRLPVLLDEELPAAQSFAAAWDARDHQLRAAALEGGAQVAVRPIPNYYHLEQLRPAGPSSWWVNWAVASYYGIGDVSLVDEPSRAGPP